MRKQIAHATNLNGIENLLNHESNGANYLCCSNITCEGFMNRDVLFLVDGEVIAEYSGDCGSDKIGSNVMGERNTIYDEVHVANDYEVEGLYWVEGKTVESYAAAFAYMIYVLQLPCEIINADEDTERQIKDWADEMEEIEMLEWLEECGIENLFA